MHKYADPDHCGRRSRRRLELQHAERSIQWGKVDTTFEQMVYSEATLALPLIAGYAYHKNAQEGRLERRWANLLEPVNA